LIPLDIGLDAHTSKLGDAIHNPIVFEGDNLVSEVGGIQLLATIKYRLKFFQQKQLMRITIIAEEELTHNVLARIKNNFSVSGLGRSFHVLLD
jgi:hypothetical protein